MEAAEEIASRRSQSYWLLARMLGEQPEKEMLHELDGWLTAANDAAHDATELAVLKSAVESALSSSEELTRLQVEYTRLLAGVSQSAGVSEAYESVAREGRLFGQCSESVAAYYIHCGMAELVHDGAPPDHISTELRFMSLLCYREAQARRAGDSAQARDLVARQLAFLGEHLLEWVPAWCENVATCALHPFYASLSTLTPKALLGDRDDILGLLDVAA